MNNGFKVLLKMLRGSMYFIRAYFLIFVLMALSFSVYGEPIQDVEKTIDNLNVVKNLASSYYIYKNGRDVTYDWYVDHFLLMRKFELFKCVRDDKNFLEDQALFVYEGLKLFSGFACQDDCGVLEYLTAFKFHIIQAYNHLDEYGKYRFGLYFHNNKEELGRSQFDPQKINEIDELIKDGLVQTAHAKLALMKTFGVFIAK